MRWLVIILFTPLISFSQMRSGLATYCTSSAPKFGVLVNSGTLSNTQKAHVLKDTLGLYWNRGALTVSTWSGSSTRYEAYQALGVGQLVVINSDAGSPTPFRTGDLTSYADTIGLMFTKYPDIWGIVVENEEINPNYHTGALADYILMVQAAYNKAHPLGIKVYDGGFYGTGIDMKVYRWLVRKYGQSAADQYAVQDSMTTAQVNAAQDSNSNPTLEAKANQIDTLLRGLPNYVDGFNIHIYEVFKQPNAADTVTRISTNVVRYQKEYVEYTTHKPCISNEFGVRNNTQPNLYYDSTLNLGMMPEYTRLGFMVLQCFDGIGADGADPITDDTTGDILPNGTAFKSFVIKNQNNQAPLLP